MTANMTDPIEVMARTIDGEAESDGAPGMIAVACVIMNRVNHPTWWGDSILSVCLLPGQFDCWCQPSDDYDRIMALQYSDPNFALALGIAYAVSKGLIADVTGGADSYYDFKTMKTPPYWAAPPSIHTVDIASSSFWKVQLS